MPKPVSKSSSSARRREVRRNVQKPAGVWRPLLRSPALWWSVLFVSLFTAFGTLFIELRDPGYQPELFVADPILSRVTFKVEDAVQTQDARKLAYDNSPRIYEPNEAYIRALRDRFASLISTGQAADLDQVPEQRREQLKLNAPAFAALKKYIQGDKPTADWNKLVNAFLARIFAVPVLSPEDFKEETGELAVNKILIQNPFPLAGEPAEQERYPVHMINVNDSDKLQAQITEAVRVFPPALQDTVRTLMDVKPQPTYMVDPDKTLARREEAAARIKPTLKEFQANQILITPGSRLTTRDVEVLEAERQNFLDQQSTTHWLLQLLGAAGSVLIIGIGIWLYLWAYKPRIIENPMRGLALTTILVLAQGLAVGLMALSPGYEFFTATTPTLMVVAVLAIAYDQRLALGIGAVHAGLVMLSLELNPAFGLVLMVGIATMVWQLDAVRTRSKIVRTGAFTGLAMAAATLVVSLATQPLGVEGPYQLIAIDTLGSLISGLAVGVVVQAVLPGLERIFKVTTAMTLKELNDASHPLLQRLAQEAPGTYQHSLRIADMAEAAADAIGGDGLLCRVGAMYHDIGKINKPLYFIENQGGGPNKHNKLSPAMSLLIIVGHVKDGIEMAREFGLPTVIRHFIESHHGTTLVEYFYHAARKQKEAEDKPGPSEFEFRYPGPKPQTREAAIMLLCDSLEAAARALPEPTPVRLEQLVETIATKRLMDGQFDECDLTLADLHKIEQSITKTLCAIYHARIKYPGPAAAGSAAKAAPAAAASVPGSAPQADVNEPADEKQAAAG